MRLQSLNEKCRNSSFIMEFDTWSGLSFGIIVEFKGRLLIIFLRINILNENNFNCIPCDLQAISSEVSTLKLYYLVFTK